MRKRISFILSYIAIIGVSIGIVYSGGTFATSLANKTPLKRMHTIILDAGHGGEDGGATSCTGVLESGINLEITKRIEKVVCLLGYKTKMIRTSDHSVYTEGTTIAQKKRSDLNNRVSTINKTENAVLISIHQNTFSDGKYSGGQVFYSASKDSRQLAELLQNQICQSINRGSNRKCKPAEEVYIMQHIDCIGVLVECGFLSNIEEEAKLRNNGYQKKIACVVASTVCNFLDQKSNH